MSQASTESQTRGQLVARADQGTQLLNAASAATLVVGLVIFVGGFFVRLHFFASLIGLITLLVGLVLQMLSRTRLQRILIVPGVIGAFVGMSLGLAHGGFGF
jgi:hypothetical protein